MPEPSQFITENVNCFKARSPIWYLFVKFEFAESWKLLTVHAVDVNGGTITEYSIVTEVAVVSEIVKQSILIYIRLLIYM